MRPHLVLAPALLVAACTTVQPQAHRGVHFTADLGLVGSRSELTGIGQTERVSGSGLGYAVGVGGAVAPDLILGGQLWGTAVLAPEVARSGSPDTSNEFTYGVMGFGPLLKYYFMPANAYVAATPSLARVIIRHVDRADQFTRWGPGLRVAAGKEWFVSQRWGLGVAAVLDLAANAIHDEASGQEGSVRTLGGGVLFSASLD